MNKKLKRAIMLCSLTALPLISSASTTGPTVTQNADGTFATGDNGGTAYRSTHGNIQVTTPRGVTGTGTISEDQYGNTVVEGSYGGTATRSDDGTFASNDNLDISASRTASGKVKINGREGSISAEKGEYVSATVGNRTKTAYK